MTLSTHFGKLLDITLVESEEIGTVGVGESTVPPIVAFHQLVRHQRAALHARVRRHLQGRNLVRELGAHRRPVPASLRPVTACRPIGSPSSTTSGCTARRSGSQVPLGEYCFEWLAAMKGKFALREKPRINYAYHFDAALYARYLRKLCRTQGREAHRGQDQGGAHARAMASVESLELKRPDHRGRLLHRLHRFSRPAHRRRAQDRLRGLEPLAALRQRLRVPDHGRRTGATVHGVLRARRRAGAGTFPCSIASATAWCSAASTCRTTKRATSWSRIPAAAPSRIPG